MSLREGAIEAMTPQIMLANVKLPWSEAERYAASTLDALLDYLTKLDNLARLRKALRHHGIEDGLKDALLAALGEDTE